MVAHKRTIEAGLTLFSAAEIRVAIVTVGEVPDDVFNTYVSLIAKHRQVELANVQSFYNPVGEQKSPFKYFPWKTGCMHFKYLSEEDATAPSPLSCLYWHRKVMGVIGVCHCPAVKDIIKEYHQFESNCKAFPDAFTRRFFAFNPTETQVEQDRRDLRNFVMIPPGNIEELAYHTEVMIHDFAACLLTELERWLLAASVNLFTSGSFVDTQEFTGASVFEDLQSKLRLDDEMTLKRRYARLQKAQGDVALLAGSPSDAFDHYSGAMDLAKVSNDVIWLATSLEGRVSAKLVDVAFSENAVRHAPSGAFSREGMRNQVDSRPSSSSDLRSRSTLQGTQEAADLARALSEEQGPSSAAEKDSDAALDASSSCSGKSVGSAVSGGFGGKMFWHTMRTALLEEEVRYSIAEAKRELKRKGALPLQIELDLKLARFLIGIDVPRVRAEISEMVSMLSEVSGGLQLPEDRLMTVVEAAQVVGAVGLARKRTLMLWQAVEVSKSMDRPDAATLEIAKKALEPAEDIAGDANRVLKHKGILQAAVPRHWGAVRTGCIEGVLALAIRARHHVEVWDCAAMLLREQYAQLSAQRQQYLVETLSAAATQMAVGDKQRPGPGPPPLIHFVRALAPAEAFRPIRLWERHGATSGGRGPFIYDPFSDRRRQEAEALRPVQWVCGEMAAVEVEVVNPTAVQLKVERLAVDAEHVGQTSSGQLVGEHVTVSTNAWKPMPMALKVPPEGPKSAKLQLIGAPAVKGTFVLTGCKITTYGVTWHQPWANRRTTLGSMLRQGRPRGQYTAEEPAAAAQARVMVVQPLPLLMATLDRATGLTASPSTPSEVTSPVGSPPRSPTATIADPKRRTARRTAVFQGELLQWHMVLENIGKHAVSELELVVSNGGSGRRRQASMVYKGLREQRVAIDGAVVQVDVLQARTQLPLAPGKEVRVPLRMHCGFAGKEPRDEQISFEVAVEYAGPLSPAEKQALEAGEGAMGRRLKVPVALKLHPLIHLLNLRFLEHYEAVPPHSAEGPCTRGPVQRLCVLQATVINHSTLMPVLVWLGPKPGPNVYSLHPPPPHNSFANGIASAIHGVETGGRSEGSGSEAAESLDADVRHSFARACTAFPEGSCLVHHIVQLPARNTTAEAPASGGKTAGTAAKGCVKDDKTWCAEELAARYSLLWQVAADSHMGGRESDAAPRCGVLPLPVSMLAAALDTAVLSMLQPTDVDIRLCAPQTEQPCTQPGDHAQGTQGTASHLQHAVGNAVAEMPSGRAADSRATEAAVLAYQSVGPCLMQPQSSHTAGLQATSQQVEMQKATDVSTAAMPENAGGAAVGPCELPPARDKQAGVSTSLSQRLLTGQSSSCDLVAVRDVQQLAEVQALADVPPSVMLPGKVVTPGQELPCQLQVANHGDVDVELHLSISSHAYGKDVQDPLEYVAVAGVAQGINLKVPSRGQVKHLLATQWFRPGAYELCVAGCVAAQEHRTRIAMHKLTVLCVSGGNQEVGADSLAGHVLL